MTNDEFIRYAKQHIRDYLPPGLENCEVRVMTIVHANDDSYTGMSLIRPGNDMGPQIPLEVYAANVRAGTSLEDAMIAIAEEITRFKAPASNIEGAFQLDNFDQMRSFLTTKLCDPKDSVRYLSDKPWTPVGDWGLLYRLKLTHGPGTIGSSPITNEIMKLWDIDLADLHRTAVDNESSQDPAWLSSVMGVFSGPNLLDGKPLSLRPTDTFVLSNKSHFNGACVVGWEGVLDRVGDVLGRNFYIVPSSIHEVMIMPDYPSRRPQDLEATLQMANSNPMIVAPQDILSNRIQYYDRKRHRLAAPERKFRL